MGEFNTKITRRLAQVAGNAVSLMANEAFGKAANFIVYAIVSRHLGMSQFGHLVLGMTLLHTFQVLAAGGLPTMLTRRVARHRDRTKTCLRNGATAALATAFTATLLMVAVAVMMNYSATTLTLILVLALALAPFALCSVLESVFRGSERMHLIAVATLPGNLAKIAGAAIVLQLGYGVIAVAAVIVACQYAVLLIELFLAAATSDPAQQGRWKPRFAMVLAKRSLPFLGTEGMIALQAGAGVLLLSKLSGEFDVGLFGSASQLLQPVSLTYRSLVGSIFPAMCHRAAASVAKLCEVSQFLVELLSLVAVPMAIVIYFLADVLLLTLFGREEFILATSVVRVLVGLVLLQPLTYACGHSLWAAGGERTILRIVCINAAVMTSSGYLLISTFGVVGASLALLLTWIVNAAQHWLAFRRLTGEAPFAAVPVRTLIGGGLMLLLILVLPFSNRLLTVAIASAAYATAIALLLRPSVVGRSFFAPLVNSP